MPKQSQQLIHTKAKLSVDMLCKPKQKPNSVVLSNLSFVFWLMRNIGELVPWKQLVEARQTALHASIPWLASCSPCLSVFSTLPTGTHTFMPKNPLTGTIICSKATRSKNGFTSKNVLLSFYCLKIIGKSHQIQEFFCYSQGFSFTSFSFLHVYVTHNLCWTIKK